MAESANSGRHLLHIFSTFDVGGSQRRFIQLANVFGPKYHHTILAMDENFSAAKGLNHDVPYTFETIPVQKTSTISCTNIMNARRLLRRVRPDQLLTYNWGAIEWVIANSLPTVCQHVHIEDGFGPEELAERQLWRRVWTRRLLLSHCDRVVVPSLLLRDVATRTWRLPPHKIRYLPNGIEFGRFARKQDRDTAVLPGIPDDVPVVGTVAALRKEKNLLRLIRVFGALPHDIGAWLVIVGDGSERAALERAAADLDVFSRIVFTGACDHPERLLGRFDVFALTSDTEQMPYSILEAMAAGIAVASTDVGDIRRMLAPENADFIVPIESEEMMTRRLARLLQDSVLRARIGRANQERVRLEYTLEQMIERYDTLFSGEI